MHMRLTITLLTALSTSIAAFAPPQLPPAFARQTLLHVAAVEERASIATPATTQAPKSLTQEAYLARRDKEMERLKAKDRKSVQLSKEVSCTDDVLFCAGHYTLEDASLLTTDIQTHRTSK